MEIFQLNNKNKEIKCPDCKEPSLLTIDPEKFKVKSTCIKGHIVNKHINNFNKCFLKSSISNSNYCGNCFLPIDELSNNYNCLTCYKLFCGNCINDHIKNKNHNNFNIFINSYLLCDIHNLKNKFICNECKVNICDECVKSHKDHNIQSLLDVIPNKKTKEEMNNKITENIEKIKKLSKFLDLENEKVNERFIKIKEYLSFLIDISEYLLKTFNFSNYNYYNYKNYNYFYNYINNKENIKEENFLNYIFHKTSFNNKDNPLKESLIQKKQVSLPINSLKNIKINNKIKNEFCHIKISNLIYFKNNIFISFEQEKNLKTINLYEYKDFSFRYLSSCSFTNYAKIEVLKKTEYLNCLLIICEKIPKVIILDYDPIHKALIFNNKQINENKKRYGFFIDAIDNKNGNILTIYISELIIWKLNDKKNKYIKDKIISENFDELMNITESLFVSQNNLKSKISFFETEKYECIKQFFFSTSIKFIGTIQNKIFLFQTLNNKNIYLLDLKYFEIIQIITCKDITKGINVSLINNYLLNIYFYNEYDEEVDYKYYKNLINNKDDLVLKIEKKIFNFDKGRFITDENYEIKLKYFSYYNILTTDNNLIVFVGHEEITLIRI